MPRTFDKPSARDHLRALRRALPTAQRAEAESRVGDHLLRLVASLSAHTVGMYAAQGSEVSLSGPAEALEVQGVSLAWPRVIGDGRLQLVRCPSGALAPGYRDILEPPASYPEVDLADVPLLLVPGVGFDPHGRRLGQGGGFYDRLIPRLGGGTLTLGVAFAVQVMEGLPVQDHDQGLRGVLTEAGLAVEGVWHVDVEGALEKLSAASPLK